jgi:hypothetical protein
VTPLASLVAAPVLNWVGVFGVGFLSAYGINEAPSVLGNKPPSYPRASAAIALDLMRKRRFVTRPAL